MTLPLNLLSFKAKIINRMSLRIWEISIFLFLMRFYNIFFKNKLIINIDIEGQNT